MKGKHIFAVLLVAAIVFGGGYSWYASRRNTGDNTETPDATNTPAVIANSETPGAEADADASAETPDVSDASNVKQEPEAATTRASETAEVEQTNAAVEIGTAETDVASDTQVEDIPKPETDTTVSADTETDVLAEITGFGTSDTTASSVPSEIITGAPETVTATDTIDSFDENITTAETIGTTEINEEFLIDSDTPHSAFTSAEIIDATPEPSGSVSVDAGVASGGTADTDGSFDSQSGVSSTSLSQETIDALALSETADAHAGVPSTTGSSIDSTYYSPGMSMESRATIIEGTFLSEGSNLMYTATGTNDIPDSTAEGDVDGLQFTPEGAHDAYADTLSVRTVGTWRVMTWGLTRGFVNLPTAPAEFARGFTYEFSIRKWYEAAGTAWLSGLGGTMTRMSAGMADIFTGGYYGDTQLAEGYPDYVWQGDWAPDVTNDVEEIDITENEDVYTESLAEDTSTSSEWGETNTVTFIDTTTDVYVVPMDDPETVITEPTSTSDIAFDSSAPSLDAYEPETERQTSDTQSNQMQFYGE